MLDEQTIFHIPAENMNRFEADCAKLSKKAVKLGCSEIKPFVFGHTTQTLEDGLEHRVYEVLFTVEAPKVNGWTFVARLDHANETGNIIRMVPNTLASLPAKYLDCAPNCDHCKQNRKRRDTFILRCDATGEFKQVGSTCLLDFFGHDPIKMARMAELLGYALESARSAEEYSGNHGIADLRWIRVDRFCEYAAACIRQFGWVSGKAAFEDPSQISTRDVAVRMYRHGAIKNINDEDKMLAVEALDWALSLREKDNKSDYEHNILVIAEAQAMEWRSAGLAASIVGVYVRNRQKEIERKAREGKTESTYYGAIGDKLKGLKATLVGYSVNTQGAYGTTHIYKFVTTAGNVLTWFATSSASIQEGNKVVFTGGTVKAHQQYRNVSQTIVSRCKLNVDAAN